MNQEADTETMNKPKMQNKYQEKQESKKGSDTEQIMGQTVNMVKQSVLHKKITDIMCF